MKHTGFKSATIFSTHFHNAVTVVSLSALHTCRQIDANLTAQHPRHTIYSSFAPSQQHVGLSTPQHFHPSDISPAASLSGGLTAALPTAASLSTAAAVRQELLDAWTAQAAQVAQRQPPELAAQMMGTWTQQAAMTQTPQLAAQLVQVRQTINHFSFESIAYEAYLRQFN